MKHVSYFYNANIINSPNIVLDLNTYYLLIYHFPSQTIIIPITLLFFLYFFNLTLMNKKLFALKKQYF